jgi:DNA-directed RNA polymerase subunit F
MIKDQKPLTYAEVLDLVGEGEKAKKVKDFIKMFYKLKSADAKKLSEELAGLDLMKLKEESIVSIVNFIPQDAADLIKILPDVSLDQEEITKILDIVKKY